jgi:post-segregation antitoxin (ccd killing protein)
MVSTNINTVSLTVGSLSLTNLLATNVTIQNGILTNASASNINISNTANIVGAIITL